MRWLLLLLLVLATPAWGNEHIVMIDVSGSMRDRGYAYREGSQTFWGPEIPDFLRKLLTPDGTFFKTNDVVTLIPFSDAGTDAREGRAPVAIDLEQLDEAILNLPTPGGGATDMSRCLDLAQAAATEDTVLTWILTDNENNLAGNQSDRMFYERLRDSPEYTHVYFFPLAPGEGGSKDALVMYLLVHTEDPQAAWVDELADSVADKTGFEGVLFRPLYGGTHRAALDFGKELKVETPEGESAVTEEGGTTILHYAEGQPLSGQLRFRIRSNLKGWKIVDAVMDEADITLKVPASIKNSPGDTRFQRQISPRKLNVGPGKESADTFLLSLEAAEGEPIMLERGFEQFISDPFASYLDDIEGKVKLSATVRLSPDGVTRGGLQPDFTPEVEQRVKHVPNLAEIEEFMVYQADLGEAGEDPNRRTIRFERRLIVRTKANPIGAILLFMLGVGSFALLAALLWAAFGWKTHYKLEGPGQEEEFTLGYFGGSYLVCGPSGHELCTLRNRFGTLSAVPAPDTEVNGSPDPAPIRWEGPEARLEVKPEGKEALYYTLVRAEKAKAGGGGPADEVSI